MYIIYALGTPAAVALFIIVWKASRFELRLVLMSPERVLAMPSL